MRAFEVIFNKYSKKIYFFVLGYLKSHEETEEIVQSSFLSLWENRFRLDESSSLKNYLYTIAVNKVFNFLKREVLSKKYLESINEIDEENPTEKEIYFNEFNAKLETILNRLPEQQRQIFILSRFDNLSNKEIAKKLQLSVRTVENQIYRALKIIKKKL